MTEYWPGSKIKKSLHNGFTLGFKGVPHGYTPGPAAPTVVKKVIRTPGGFARNNGTITGMRPGSFTIKKRTGAMA